MKNDPARTYHRWRLILASVRLLAAGMVLGVATWVLARTRLLPAPANRGELVLLLAVELGLLGAVLGLATAPLTVAAAYWLPRRAGLLHQPWPRWVLDRAKGLAIRAPLGVLALLAVYALLSTTSLWWLGAAVLFFAGRVIGVAVTPTWLLPLFYRLTPLADAGLCDRVLALAARARVPVLGVWVGDQSRKSRTANATVTGLGRTRRIILWDTLLARFTPNEVEFVLAHELGHHVHGDIPRMLLLDGALLLATFGLMDPLLHISVAAWGWSGVADPAGLPWLLLLLNGFGLAGTPLRNTFSRRLERRADDFAVAITGNVAAAAGTITRLGSLNLAERRPHRLVEALLYTHPSIDRRLARLGSPAPPEGRGHPRG
jgi:STE24 endopeptidase